MTFHGVPATGRSVSTSEFAFYRVDAGRAQAEEG
jgi:hypothetical protein